jgi:hypothetical protein
MRRGLASIAALLTLVATELLLRKLLVASFVVDAASSLGRTLLAHPSWASAFAAACYGPVAIVSVAGAAGVFRGVSWLLHRPALPWNIAVAVLAMWIRLVLSRYFDAAFESSTALAIEATGVIASLALIVATAWRLAPDLTRRQCNGA